MARRRWIADEVTGSRAVLVGEHARHLSHVLRARIGQEFEIATGAEVRQGRISSIFPDRVEFDLGEVVTQPAAFPITVAISIFKFDRMEWAIEKCTELGVWRIMPILAARTEAHLAKAASKRVERWKRIVQQASEQSRRTSPPEISQPVRFKDMLSIAADARFVLSETESELMLKDAIPPNPNSLLLAFGPEGGWKEEELAACCDAGWTSASLGKTILRAETAVIAALAIATSSLS
jgi:16S rRNA (uracil1498-N3)-methyltransferase